MHNRRILDSGLDLRAKTSRIHLEAWPAQGVQSERRMQKKMIAFAMLALASGACSTTTAHRLPLSSNPLRAEAEACERRCRSLLVPVSACWPGTTLESPCDSTARYVDREPYAVCLDSCPGASAVDGTSCPASAGAGVLCEETSKANPGGVAGGVVAAVGIVLGLLVASAALSFAGDVVRREPFGPFGPLGGP